VLRVTADTNIFISGLNFEGGKPFQFLALAKTGRINLTTSEAILDEVASVLARKFDYSAGDLEEARRFVVGLSRIVRPSVRLDVVKEDPDDNRVLECAVTAGADFIVSGDNDLLRLGWYDSIRIVNVSDFLKLIDALPSTTAVNVI
jgi:putative PIN family toxin of toxin-antitoxin system